MLIKKPKTFGEWHLQIGDLVYILPTDKDITKQRVGRYEGYTYAPRSPLFRLPDDKLIVGYKCWWIPVWEAEKAKETNP